MKFLGHWRHKKQSVQAAHGRAPGHLVEIVRRPLTSSPERNATRKLKSISALMGALSLIGTCSSCSSLSLFSLFSLFSINDARAMTIEGKIEHVEKLPEVAPEFKPGISFDEKALPVGVNNNWVRIPSWMAGTWLVRTETAVYMQNFKTGQIIESPTTYSAKHEFTYGSQVDKQGEIWHFIGVPYTSKTTLSNYDEIHEVTTKDFLVASDAMVQFRTLMTVARVSRSSDKIISSFQQESITCYKPVSPDVIELTSSTKSFDAAGNPDRLTRNTATIKRIKQFRVRDEQDGKDLKTLFGQYLYAKGLSAIAP